MPKISLHIARRPVALQLPFKKVSEGQNTLNSSGAMCWVLSACLKCPLSFLLRTYGLHIGGARGHVAPESTHHIVGQNCGSLALYLQ